MSRRALMLPIRALSGLRPRQAQWTCRRCLATETEGSHSINSHAPLASSAPPAPTPESQPAENALKALPDPQRRDWRSMNLTNLGQPLPHAVPRNHLVYCDVEALTPEEAKLQEKILAIPSPKRRLRGVVVSAGKSAKTVRVRIPGQVWNKKLGKFFDTFTNHLVHDERNSLIEGDIIELHNLRTSTAVLHTVGAILVPFGKPIADRPAVETPEERLHNYKTKRFAKIRLREVRRLAEAGDENAIAELKARGTWQDEDDEGVATGPKETRWDANKKRFGNQRAVPNKTREGRRRNHEAKVQTNASRKAAGLKKAAQRAAGEEM